jgi:lipopolysaccharide biosynthesis glycosyltransferase
LRLKDLKIGGHVTTATYFSLLVPEFVSDRFDRAIYLDCDILVRASVQPLWHLPFNGKALLAVRDFLIPTVSDPAGLTKFAALGLDSRSPYFNCGVLVYNLDRWRQEGIALEIFRYLREYRDFLNFRDQEGLNAVLCNDCGLIDPTWNVQSSILSHEAWPPSDYKDAIRSKRADLIQNPQIIHFVGPSKPWHLDCRHPAKRDWYRHLAASAWHDAVRANGSHTIGCEFLPPTEVELGKRVKLTVAVLSAGSSGQLQSYLRKALSGELTDVVFLILDDAPTGKKRAVVESFHDARLTYRPLHPPMGGFGARQWALDHTFSPYFLVHSDEAPVAPDLIAASVVALDVNPDAGFSVCSRPEAAGSKDMETVQATDDASHAIVPGLRVLHDIVCGQDWCLDEATIVMRRTAIAAIQWDLSLHRKTPVGDNLHLQLAAKFNVAVITPSDRLARAYRTPTQGQPSVSPSIATINDAIACLSRTPLANDDAYRAWLAERLLAWNSPLSYAVRALGPLLDAGMGLRRQDVWDRIVAVVPEGEGVVLVDEETRLKGEVRGRTIWPFLERDGRFWGNPRNDDEAIRGLEELRQRGIRYFAITEAAHWWIDHYAGFFQYLRSFYGCSLEADSLMVFDLVERRLVPPPTLAALISTGGVSR